MSPVKQPGKENLFKKPCMYFHIPVSLHFVRHFSWLEWDFERAVMGTQHTVHLQSTTELLVAK